MYLVFQIIIYILRFEDTTHLIPKSLTCVPYFNYLDIWFGVLPGPTIFLEADFSLLFPRLFETPKYRDYSYQFRDFELYLTKELHPLWGDSNWRRENKDTESEGKRNEANICFFINPPHLSDFPTTERNIPRPSSTLRTCSPSEQSHHDWTYFTTLQRVFHILVWSLKPHLACG